MLRSLCLMICLLAIAGPAAAADQPNTLSADEKTQGFELLFDGKSLAGWDQKGNWKAIDGAIAWQGKGGSITYKTKKVPDDFELRFDWKVGPGSNSGVYYRPTQYEYQVLDNQKHADGRNPRTSAASIYFCVAPSKDATRPVGEWNSGRVVCQGTVVQHWLNGEKVVDLDYADPRNAQAVELLKRRGGDLTARGAMLNLQDHGDPVWYRSIRLRTIPAGEKLDRTPVTPAIVPPEALKHEQEILQRVEQQRAKAKAKAEAGKNAGKAKK